MSDVRFSVVIATFNQKEYVLEAVRSVMDQTYPAHEVIVVADGCSDGSADAIRALFPSVRVIDQPNLGKCIARNTGIGAATGKWICILDHDDLFHREKLERLASYIERHSDCLAVTHPVWYFSETLDGPVEGYGFHRDLVARNCAEAHQRVAGAISKNELLRLNTYGDSFNLLLDRQLGAMSAATVNREALLRAGMFSPMQFNGEDWTMFVNVARLGEWHFIPDRLAFTRLHSASGTYEETGGLMQLACQINAWFAGRPLRHHTRGLEFLKELEQRRLIHRFDVQKYLWAALLRGQFTLARLIHAAGALLLPRWRDRMFVLVPPQLTWRWEHRIRPKLGSTRATLGCIQSNLRDSICNNSFKVQP